VPGQRAYGERKACNDADVKLPVAMTGENRWSESVRRNDPADRFFRSIDRGGEDGRFFADVLRVRRGSVLSTLAVRAAAI